MSAQAFRVTGFDHIGIRVTDRDRSIAFYGMLGFVQTDYFAEHQANEMETPDGVRINLIMNGARRPGNRNVLMDEPIKLPGHTHPAFIVDDLARLEAHLHAHGIPITEGPAAIGPRRIALFIRDPDGNVLEFDQLL
jgi:lactoylglutathione lyase